MKLDRWFVCDYEVGLGIGLFFLLLQAFVQNLELPLDHGLQRFLALDGGLCNLLRHFARNYIRFDIRVGSIVDSWVEVLPASFATFLGFLGQERTLQFSLFLLDVHTWDLYVLLGLLSGFRSIVLQRLKLFLLHDFDSHPLALLSLIFFFLGDVESVILQVKELVVLPFDGYLLCSSLVSVL